MKIKLLAFFLLLTFKCFSQTKESRSKEKLPEFPGQEVGMMNFISSKLVYPPSALKDKIQGKVYVSFVVGPDGKVDSAAVIKGIRKDLDDEALKIIN
jgi:protein TonB